MKTQDWQNNTSIKTPWGWSQQSRCIAEGITQVSTAGHGGIVLDDERWAEFQRRIPGYTPRYGGPQCFEEDCEWAAVVIAFPEHYDEQAIYDAVQTCRVWMKEIVIPAELLAREESHRSMLYASGVWERGSCSTGGGEWRVGMKQVGEGGASLVVLMKDYPVKRYYTSKEVAGMRRAA